MHKCDSRPTPNSTSTTLTAISKSHIHCQIQCHNHNTNVASHVIFYIFIPGGRLSNSVNVSFGITLERVTTPPQAKELVPTPTVVVCAVVCAVAGCTVVVAGCTVVVAGCTVVVAGCTVVVAGCTVVVAGCAVVGCVVVVVGCVVVVVGCVVVVVGCVVVVVGCAVVGCAVGVKSEVSESPGLPSLDGEDLPVSLAMTVPRAARPPMQVAIRQSFAKRFIEPRCRECTVTGRGGCLGRPGRITATGGRECAVLIVTSGRRVLLSLAFPNLGHLRVL
jgi:hypothetical protein